MPLVNVSTDLREVRTHLRSCDSLAALRSLERPAPLMICGLIGLEWILILGSWALTVYVSPWLLPLSCLIIGTRQRALGNFLHQASHRLIANNIDVNNAIGRYLLAMPLYEDFVVYRRNHIDHHRYLGDPSRDPDYVHPDWFAHVDAASPFAPLRIYLSLLRRKLAFALKVRIDALCWWSVFIYLLSLISGQDAALDFAALWLVSHVTIHRAITVFTELSDHTFAPVTTNFQYTRNIPRSFLTLIFYPYNDHLHLTHHLFPNVPIHKLRKAHTLLSGMIQYAEAQNTYGLMPLLSGWRLVLPSQPRIVHEGAPILQRRVWSLSDAKGM